MAIERRKRKSLRVGWTILRKEGRKERFKGLARVGERGKKELSCVFFFGSSGSKKAKKRGEKREEV